MKIKIVFVLLFLSVFIKCDHGCLFFYELDTVVVSHNNKEYVMYPYETSYKKLPCGIDKVVIKRILTGDSATVADKQPGDTLRVNERDSIIISRTDKHPCVKEIIYEILLESEACSGSGFVLGRK